MRSDPMRTFRPDLSTSRGFSLTELIVSIGIITIVMGATLAGLSDMMKGNELVMSIASMNSNLRGGMDLMVRDMLQAASGLPGSHTVSIPNGAGSARVNLPGPPGPVFQLPVDQPFMPAVIPRNGAGPVINGVATDVVSILMADNDFLDATLTAVTDTQVTVSAASFIAAGPARVTEGQLMMISKGSVNTLVQVTAVDVPNRRLTFDDGDSLNLNQAGAANGSLAALNADVPVNDPTATRISRVRLLTYYLDNTTDPARPRLVRRINNGHPTVFNNALGTAVAVDVYDLQVTYDITNGVGNPSGVDMSAADLGGGGACAPDPCAETQIRKVTLLLTARAPNQVSGNTSFLTNTLESQVSLRAMAFVDRYR
jgi:prepilin-type N-terminal cleavage/methylation domain-containing protein